MNVIATMVILWVARSIILFPLLTFFAKISVKENKGKFPLPLKIMSLHTLLAFFLQVCIIWLDFLHINYIFLVYIYIVEEFILDMLFYRELLKKTHPFKDIPEKRPIFVWAIILFIAFAIINATAITGINQFPVYLFVTQCVIMIICTTWYDYNRSFYEVVPPSGYETQAYKLYKGPVFWMNRGKLIYFSTILLIIVLYNITLSSGTKDMALIIWRLQDIVLIILHIFMGIGFLKFTGDPEKVMDWEGNYKKTDNNIQRKRYKSKELEYMNFLKDFPEYFNKFKSNNPDLIPHSYTIENHIKDINDLQRKLYLSQTPDIIAFFKSWPSIFDNFKKDNPDLFNETSKG